MPEALLETVREQLAQGGRVEQENDLGRLHIDRPLPFLCVYRRPPARPDRGTARLISSQAAYLMAPGAAERHGEVAALVSAVGAAAVRAWGGFLVVEVWSALHGGEGEESDPFTLRPGFRVVAPEEEGHAGMVEAMAKAFKHIRLHGQPAEVAVTCRAAPAPPGLPPLLLPDAAANPFVIGLEVVPVYRDRETDNVFPFLLEELRRQLSDVLKRLFFHFACRRTSLRPPHYQALGRRGVEEVALDVDRQLAEIDVSLNFLLQVTPVNAEDAWEGFRKDGYRQEPVFYYRPLSVDPELLKRTLFSLPLERVEDPTLAWLFREKQEELDRKLTMLRDRGTRPFFFGSLQLYGEVHHDLLALAEEILDRLPVHDYDYEAEEHLDAEEFAQVAAEEFAYYRQACPIFPETAQIRSDIPAGLMVSQGRLLIGQASRTPAVRVDALLQHEVGTHMLTYFNGRQQPFRLLYAGLAGYEALQEGLAVLAEYLVGGLNIPRLRVLAARVVAAHGLIEGTSFVEMFRLMAEAHSFAPKVAWNLTMRTFRAGGLIKDVIYLRGLHELMEYLRRGGDLEPLFVGKIALHHLPVMEELAQRGVLRPAPLRPRYLAHERTYARLERVYGGLTFVDLVEKHLS